MTSSVVNVLLTVSTMHVASLATNETRGRSNQEAPEMPRKGQTKLDNWHLIILFLRVNFG